MQIALTKKLADAMSLKPEAADCENPLFAWTANWSKVWDTPDDEE